MSGQLLAIAIGFLLLWVLVGYVIRKWLDRLAAEPRAEQTQTRRTRALLVSRYEEWGSDFVSFLVYWAGGVALFFGIGVVMAVTGHFGWFVLCLGGAAVGVLTITAAVKHGKGSLRNVWRLITRA
jgi:hypothetical protein